MIRVLSEWDLHRGLLLQVCSLLHQDILGKGEGTDVGGGEKRGGLMMAKEKVMDIMTRFLRRKGIRKKMCVRSLPY
jgi:hypothetical protein